MEEEVCLNRDNVSSLLNPVSTTVFKTEEEQHSWRTHYFQIFDKPFLRLWDHCSGSQLDGDGCMKSRAERERLDTFESRKDSLTIHINHKIWTPTPYISFSTSPSKIEDLANLRAQRASRGPHTLTVVDPNIRVRNGLPVLHVADEIEHYGIADPYGNGNEYYEDHYICLWEVTKREIVGHWEWDDLVADDNWYQNVIMPALMQFGREAVPTSSGKKAFDLSALMNTLPPKAATDPSEPTSFLNRQSDLSRKELVCYFDDEFDDEYDDFNEAYDYVQDESGTDTDDEVEEANAFDDMIKIIEGNW